MLFALVCQDKPDALGIRMNNRQAHLAYLEVHADQLVYAGPLLDRGDQPIGSLIVLDVPDRAAVEAFAAEDPYARAGLFAEVAIHATRQVYPKA